MNNRAIIRLITAKDEEVDTLIRIIQDIEIRLEHYDTVSGEYPDLIPITAAHELNDRLTAYYLTTYDDYLDDRQLRIFINQTQAHIIIAPGDTNDNEIDNIIADDIEKIDDIEPFNKASVIDPHIHTITLDENLDEETATLDNGTTIKPLPTEYQNGYAGKYYAGNDGNIYSTKRNNTHTLTIGDTLHQIAFKDNGGGYLIANNKTQHELIASAWIGPRPEGYEIDHIDGNPKNNKPDNLEYVTPFENKYRALVNTHRIGTYHPFTHAPHLHTRNIFDKTPTTWREIDCPTTPNGFKTITNGHSFFDNNTRRTALIITNNTLINILENIQKTPGFTSYELDAYSDETDIAIEYNTTDDIIVTSNRLLRIKNDTNAHIDIDTFTQYHNHIIIYMTIRF